MTISTLASVENTQVISPRLQRLVDRITPIEQPIVSIGYMPVSDIKGLSVDNVNIDWDTNNRNVLDAGHIEISLVEKIIPGSTPDEPVLVEIGDRHLALSSISADAKYDVAFVVKERSAAAGSRAFFTLVGTLNEAAKVSGKPITHMAQCNPHTISLLERLRAEGIYHYCNLDGAPSEQPQTFMGQTLFACNYPVENLDIVFVKFAVKDAVEKIKDLRA